MQNAEKSLFALSRIRIFEILAVFPEIELHHAGELFADAFLTPTQADEMRSRVAVRPLLQQGFSEDT
jgi:hypothetical protein